MVSIWSVVNGGLPLGMRLSYCRSKTLLSVSLVIRKLFSGFPGSTRFIPAWRAASLVGITPTRFAYDAPLSSTIPMPAASVALWQLMSRHVGVKIVAWIWGSVDATLNVGVIGATDCVAVAVAVAVGVCVAPVVGVGVGEACSTGHMPRALFTAWMISLIVMSPLPSASPGGHAESCALPRAMLTMVMISLTVTSPLPSQSPTHVATHR